MTVVLILSLQGQKILAKNLLVMRMRVLLTNDLENNVEDPLPIATQRCAIGTKEGEITIDSLK